MLYGENITQFHLSSARTILLFWFLNYPKYIFSLCQNKVIYTVTKFGMGGPVSQFKCEFIYRCWFGHLGREMEAGVAPLSGSQWCCAVCLSTDLTAKH